MRPERSKRKRTIRWKSLRRRAWNLAGPPDEVEVEV
jgi:hypothetical protein